MGPLNIHSVAHALKRTYEDDYLADCNDYKGRMKWSGNYDSYICSITISNAQPEDAGVWKCEIEKYNGGKYRGIDQIINAHFNIEINVTSPTTTTSSITTKNVSASTQMTGDGADKKSQSILCILIMTILVTLL